MRNRAELKPVIEKLAREKPIMEGVADLWLIAYNVDQHNTNLQALERVLLGDLFNGQYKPRDFFTARETWIARKFYDRGSTTRPPDNKENEKMAYLEPTNGREIGINFNGPHWDPRTEKEEALKANSENSESFTSEKIRGFVGKTEAYGRPHFTIKPIDKKEFFLLPDHAALMSKLEKVKEGTEVFISYDGMIPSESTGRNYHSYRVVSC